MAIADAYPLTRLQAGMFFHAHLDAGGATYHDLLNLKISGPLDAGRMRGVLAALTAGHEVLRSGVDLVGFSEPVQLVHDEVEPPLTVDDLRGLPGPEQAGRIAQWRELEKRRPFDLGVPPLLRVHAQVLTDDTFWLNVSFHHAMLDGWSLSLLVLSLLREYDRALSGEAVRVPRPPARFRDYVLLEREALADDRTRGYWRALVEDVPVTEPARWRDGLGGSTGQGAHTCPVPLRADLTAKVRALAAGARISAKSVLFAAHASVLSRLCGESVVMTGRVANCRPETAGAEQMIGLFLNSIPLVLDTRRSSWLDLARQAHRAETAATAHRRYPLGQILVDVNADALFETLVDYRSMRSYGELALTNLRIEDTNFFEQTNFPLTANFSADPATGDIRLVLNYDSGEFPAAQIDAVAGYYAAALAAISDEPDAPVSRTGLLSPAELTRQLTTWNDTGAELPARSLPALLAVAGRRHRDRVALRFGEREVSYGQLYARARRLAGQLRDRGVGPDVPIGVHMRRSPEMVTALLGILLAGGAYLPLDPEYPAERLAFVLADSKAALVLTDAGSAPPRAAAEVLSIGAESLAGGPDDEPDDEPGPGPRPDQLAYVIYTSGSTGRPKGVQVSHDALANLLLAMSAEVGLTAEDRWLATTSLSFDIAGLELFAPLLAGAELIILPDHAVDGPELAAGLDRATIVQATPSGWRMFLEGRLGQQRRIRAICGGEALPADLMNQLAVRAAAAWNAYGPTETTIWSCLQPLRSGEAVSIGRPLANTQVYVLDDDLRPAPVGVAGELYIGGRGLARGYHDRAGLTAVRFVASPFGEPGSRLFRTGDTVRRRPDGTLEFIGRSDHQVKVHGFRIELGEIESVLAEHEAVGQAVVTVRDRPGGAELAAYLVAAAGAAALPSAELRAYVAARLPDYMVPAAYAWLPALPLTPNAKIDRRALPDIGRSGTAAGRAVEPTTPTQSLVAAVWTQELGLDRVGVTDTFRDLGGRSIAALRVVLRLKEATGTEIPLASLLVNGTVAALAHMIDSGRPAPHSILVPLLETAGPTDQPPLFLVHPLGGTVFCYTELADAIPPDQPLVGIQAFDLTPSGGTGPDSVEEIAERYLEAVRAVQPEGPYRLGGWCMGGIVAFEMARRLEEAGERTATLAIIDSSFADPVPPAWVDDEAAVILGAFADTLPITLEELRAVPPADRLRHALSVAEGHVARPDVGGVEDLRRLIALYRRHARALLAYRDRPYPPYHGDALVIRGELAPHVEADLGWRPRIDGRLLVVETPGDHRSLLSRPHVTDLVDKLVVTMRDGLDGLRAGGTVLSR
jgi:amino acid adenylation domain-containing protein